MAQACLGAISGPDGATEEQLTILRAIACNVWGLDPADLTPESALTPQEAAAGIVDEQPRRRTREMMVMLELRRHPLELSHEQRVREYCFALGGESDAFVDGAGAVPAEQEGVHQPSVSRTISIDASSRPSPISRNTDCSISTPRRP